MSGAPWPRLLDLSEDNARKALRTLELAAYSSLVATFRAQGDLTADKKKLLQQLKELLGISNERHQGELRRCVNDEKLSTIAYHMVGPNHDNEWLIEGRRLAPLSQRLALHTAFTSAANQAVAAQVDKNNMQPNPSQTGSREQFTAAGTLHSPPQIAQTTATSPNLSSPGYLSSTAPVTKYSRPQSPNTNVVILPSGTSIHIKGNVGAEEEEDITGTKRRRLASTETTLATTKQIVGQGQTTLATTKQIVGRGQPAPIKLTLNNKASPATSSAQKVILVQSSSGQTMSVSSAANIRKTAANSTVPIVKSVTPIISHTRTSVVYPASSSSETSSTSGPTIHTHQGLTIQRPRAKATLTTTPRITTGGVKPSITVSRHGVVIPTNSGSVTSRSGVHVKQEGAMKIITSSNNKLLPRPSAANSTPIVVVTSSAAGGSGRISSPSPNRNTVITAGAGAVAINNKVISIHATGKLINPSISQKSTGQKITAGAVKSANIGTGQISSHTITTSTSTSRPGNVVIVQQPRQAGAIKSSMGGTVMGNKEFVSFIQRHGTSLADKTSSSSTVVPATIKTISTSSLSSHSKQSSDLPKATYIPATSKSHSQVIVTPLSDKNKSSAAPASIVSTAPVWLSTSDAYTTASSVVAPTSSVSADTYVSASSPPKMDIFSSALAEADINLDPYEFIDEDEPVVASTATTPTSSIEEPPQWSCSTTDNSSSLFHLSQGAAILSGELPFLPSSTSSMTKSSPPYVQVTTSEDAVIDRATSLLAHASTMLAQSTKVHTPPVSASNPITCSSLAPLGAQAILPKGKELIRILPVMAGGSTMVTSSSALVSRPHLTIQSRTSTSSSNSRQIDIQPRSGDFSSPPFIDTKILILPPGIAQPSTPVKEASAELVDSLGLNTNEPAISTSLLNFVNTSQQQDPTTAEIRHLESPVLDAKLVASLQQIGSSAVSNEVIVSSEYQPSDSASNHPAFQSILGSNEIVCSSTSIEPNHGMVSLLAPAHATETVVCDWNDELSSTSKARSLQDHKTVVRNILQDIKVPKFSRTARSNILPWEKEAETTNDAGDTKTVKETKSIEGTKIVNKVKSIEDIKTVIETTSTKVECTVSKTVAVNPTAVSSIASPHQIIESVQVVTTHSGSITSTSSDVHKTADIPAQTLSAARVIDKIVQVSQTFTKPTLTQPNNVILTEQQSTTPTNVTSDGDDSFQDLVSDLAPTENDSLPMHGPSNDAAALLISQQIDTTLEVSQNFSQNDSCTNPNLIKEELPENFSSSSISFLDKIDEPHLPLETVVTSEDLSTECTDSAQGAVVSSEGACLSIGGNNSLVKEVSLEKSSTTVQSSENTLFQRESGDLPSHPAQDSSNSLIQQGSMEPATNSLQLDNLSVGFRSNSNSIFSHQTYRTDIRNDCKDVISSTTTGSTTTTTDLYSSSQPVQQPISMSDSTTPNDNQQVHLASCNVVHSYEVTSDSNVPSDVPSDDIHLNAIQTYPDGVHASGAQFSDIKNITVRENDNMDTKHNTKNRSENEPSASADIKCAVNEDIKVEAPDVGDILAEVQHGESSNIECVSNDLRDCQDEKSYNSDSSKENQAFDVFSHKMKAEVDQEVIPPVSVTSWEPNTACSTSTDASLSAEASVNERLTNNTDTIPKRSEDELVTGSGVVKHKNTVVSLKSHHNDQIDKSNDCCGTQSRTLHPDIPNANLNANSNDTTSCVDNLTNTECSSTSRLSPSEVEHKSDDSLSDSSPPLIARRNFERVYRPRNSRTLSTAISLDAAPTQESSSPPDAKPPNSPPNTNGTDELAISATDSSPTLVDQKSSEDLKTGVIEAPPSFPHQHQNSKESLTLINGKLFSQEPSDVKSSDAKDVEAEDWLTDSGHSLSNGPTSIGDEESEEDENSNDMAIVSPGTEKVVRRGRKKRRRSDQSPSWSRAALGLLKRVMMFRGANRNKGEHGAAAWFLKPVSDDEAPGYSDVITQPMDFGTIKRKLETNLYPSVESFKSDMLLIHSNCCKYNPPEHNVRRDCELVFVYFRQEYEKLIARLQQTAGIKKVKVECDQVEAIDT